MKKTIDKDHFIAWLKNQGPGTTFAFYDCYD
jgi:hypothetical protein